MRFPPAVKYLKRPMAIVRFPGETHELSRSGQPWHRVERLQAIVGWFDKYLLGKDVVLAATPPLPSPRAPSPVSPSAGKNHH